jgi:hypothetical protein
MSGMEAIESIINDIIETIELTSNQFSIGLSLPNIGLFPRARPIMAIKRKYQASNSLIYTIPFVLTEKKLLIPCPYLDLELLLINSSPRPWTRGQILKQYKNGPIIPHTPDSLAFEVSLPFNIPNPYQTRINFLTTYIKKEQKCRWQFKKLMNFWLYKKYHKRLFNTTDPMTACEPESPVYLYNAKQRGSYVFDICFLKKHFETALKSSEYMIPKPIRPKNPFTNIPFSLADQITIIEAIVKSGKSSWFLEGYKAVGYKLSKFCERFKVALRCEIIDDYCRNPQTDDSKEHMIEFLEYVFEIYEYDYNESKLKILKWAVKTSYNDPFIKIWRKIYVDYHYILYQNPTADLNDKIYENIFRKMAENLKKANEFKRMAEQRLYEAINSS